MTWRDTLEIGLKESAAYCMDNLPPAEISGPQVTQGPGRSAEVSRSRVKGHTERSGGAVDAPGKTHRPAPPTDAAESAMTTQPAKLRAARSMVKTNRRRGRA